MDEDDDRLKLDAEEAEPQDGLGDGRRRALPTGAGHAEEARPDAEDEAEGDGLRPVTVVPPVVMMLIMAGARGSMACTINVIN